MKRCILLIALTLTAIPAFAQTPTLNQFFGKNGIDNQRDSGASANNNIFTLDPPGYPRGVSTGSLIIMSGTWPDSLGGTPTTCAAHCLPTFTDNNSNVLTPVFSGSVPCKDGNNIDHGIYYESASPGAYYVTEHHPARITNSYWSMSNWYNTTSTLDGSSCTHDIVPASNTAPNIQGTPFSTTVGDLVYVEVDDNSSGTVRGWNSIAVPSNCTLLEENNFQGHAELYCIAQSNIFTPQFTISQSSHGAFTIMAAAFKPGNAGSAPSTGTAVLLSAQNMTGGPETRTFNVGCPTSTSAVAFTDDASYITAVHDGGDGNGASFTKVTPGGGPATIWYKMGTVISNPNTYTITMTTGGGGVDLLTVYCLNATQIDTGVTAGGSSSVIAAGTVYNGIVESGGGGTSQHADLPTMTPSLPGDLFIISGTSGIGPILTCYQPLKCVYDFPSPSALADVTNGDANDYTNGDLGGHFWQAGTGQINFGWTMQNNAAGTSAVVTAFSGTFTATPPSPPTGLQAIVN
ncbi:MAG TPA: hypothetical protein VJN92_18295 [Candidatus Acidoferrum sp.]|nr:hypothetical protein [Candidatus Acidoferrum sp.]